MLLHRPRCPDRRGGRRQICIARHRTCFSYWSVSCCSTTSVKLLCASWGVVSNGGGLSLESLMRGRTRRGQEGGGRAVGWLRAFEKWV